MSRKSRHFLTCAVLLVAIDNLLLAGCSLLESSSDIVSSPFESSSASFAGKEEKYQDEVASYTYAYVSSSTADYAGYRKGLAEIAGKYGITNWEAQPITYNAIGRGLKRAKLEGIEYETFKKNLSAGEMTKMEDIDAGYRSED
jgi:hypothetical protein